MTQLESSILSFLDKIENGEEGSLSLDSSVYYLEAAFNYRYAQSGKDTMLDISQTDTTFVDITVGEEGCQYTSLGNTYDDMYSALMGIFEDIDYQNKALHIVDVEYKEVDGDDKLLLASIMKGAQYMGLNGNWYWGMDQGRCDGTNQPLDATDAIEWKNDIYYSQLLPFGIWSNIKSTIEYSAANTIMELPPFQNNPLL